LFLVYRIRRMTSNYKVVREEISGPYGKIIALQFSWNGEPVPAILMIPHGSAKKAPVALLLHGFGIDKESMSGSIGASLLSMGIGSLAFDLPFHGERRQSYFIPPTNPFQLMNTWNSLAEECRRAVQFLLERPEFDPGRIALAGYSFGGLLGLKAAASDPSIKAVVLAAAGDFPDYVPFIGTVRKLGDPLEWVRRLNPRPLLMMHGRQDRIVPPELAERLFAAAGEPKRILWFDSDHILPQESMLQAARWLQEYFLNS
jgi:uncharacterized protein